MLKKLAMFAMLLAKAFTEKGIFDLLLLIVYPNKVHKFAYCLTVGGVIFCH